LLGAAVVFGKGSEDEVEVSVDVLKEDTSDLVETSSELIGLKNVYGITRLKEVISFSFE
jgi:hypothetical protein